MTRATEFFLGAVLLRRGHYRNGSEFCPHVAMKNTIRVAAFAAAILGTFTTASAQTVEGLLGRVPESANFVVVVNNRALLQTPRATREGWSKMREFEYLAGAIPVPSSVPLAVMGSQIESGELTGSWSLAVFVCNKRIPLKDLAEREGGRVETMLDNPVAVTPRYGYMIQLVDDVYGAMFSASRQEFSRWVKTRGKAKTPAVNDYLKQVVGDSKGVHVAIAVDLDELVDPGALRGRLGTLKCLAGKSKEEIDNLQKLIAGIQGVRITVKVGDTSRTAIRLDFAQDIGACRDLLKPCMDEMVAGAGATIPEFEKAKWKCENKSAIVEADLPDGSLARLMTIALMPMHATESAPVGATAEEVQLISTRRYYRAVVTLLNDIRKQTETATDYKKTAMWHENFAARIDQLPQDGVDPYMTKFGYNCANRLRTIGASLKGVPVKHSVALAGLDIRVGAVPTGVFRTGRGLAQGWGGYAVSNSAQVLEKQAQAIADDELARNKVWDELDADRRQIRQTMLQKFNVDFDGIK